MNQESQTSASAAGPGGRATGQKPIHVFTILRYYYPEFSGAGNWARQICSRLVREGFVVTVLTQRERRDQRLSKEQMSDGVSIRRLPINRPASLGRGPVLGRLSKVWALVMASLNRLSFSVSCIWIIRRTAPRHSIVQIYGCNEFTFLIVAAAHLLKTHPVIRMTLQGSDDPMSAARGPLGRLARRAYASADAVISLSTPMSDSYRAAGLDPDKLVQIANGVDCERFHPLSHSEKRALRDRLGLDQGKRYIAFVGTAYLRKGIDILVEAIVQVATQVPNVGLLIVGPSELGDTGRYRPERSQHVASWHERLDQAGLSGHVLWTGMVENVADYLQAADIFCLPSRREGMPSAVLEAMATGLPVVVSALNGISADIILAGRDGSIVEGENPDLYARQILDLLNNPEEAATMGQNARRRIEQEFTVERSAVSYSDLYRRLAQS